MTDKALSSLTQGSLDTGDFLYGAPGGNSRKVQVGNMLSGHVAGPASSTDNAIARYHETTGKIIQDSSVTIDDSDNIAGVVNLTQTGYQDIAEISEPASPAANTARVRVIDDGAGVTTVGHKDSSGNIVPWSHFNQSGTGNVTRTQQAKLREIYSVADFGAVSGDTAGNLLTAFQDAIDALPSTPSPGGGYIYIPPGDYSNLVPASLDDDSGKIIHWMAGRGVIIPEMDIGGFESTKQISEPDGDGGSNRTINCYEHLDFGNIPLVVGTRQYGYHVNAFLDDDALTSTEKEFRAYSFTLGTDTTNDGADIRGMKGRVYADGGAGNIRAIYGVAEGYGGHTGQLTGLLGTVVRADGLTQSMVAVRGHIQPGSSSSNCKGFEAAGNGGDRTGSYAYDVRGGTGGAFNAAVACYGGHGSGGGRFLEFRESATDGTVIFEVDNNGDVIATAHRSGTITIADDAVGTLTPPSTSGLITVFAEGVSSAFGQFFYRTSGTELAQAMSIFGTVFQGPSPAVTPYLVTNTTPTGTTGDDTKVGFYVDGGNIYIENRSGASRTFVYQFIAS